MSSLKLKINVMDGRFATARFESKDISISDLSIAIAQLEKIKMVYLSIIEKIHNQTGKKFKWMS